MVSRHWPLSYKAIDCRSIWLSVCTTFPWCSVLKAFFFSLLLLNRRNVLRCRLHATVVWRPCRNWTFCLTDTLIQFKGMLNQCRPNIDVIYWQICPSAVWWNESRHSAVEKVWQKENSVHCLLRILLYFTIAVNFCLFKVSVLFGRLFQKTSFILIMKTSGTVYPPSTANQSHCLRQPNRFKATQKKQTSMSEYGSINLEAGTRCHLYSALIRGIVFSISNGPMCAAMAQRQLVRCSLAGRRKTGVDAKLVDMTGGKLPKENTARLLALGFGVGLVVRWERGRGG